MENTDLTWVLSCILGVVLFGIVVWFLWLIIMPKKKSPPEDKAPNREEK